MRRVHSARKAFSLVEIVMALGVAAFCLVAVFGLLPVGLHTSQAAVDQTNANRILAAVAVDLRATAPGQSTTQQYRLAIPGSGAGTATTLYLDASGGSAASIQADSRYRLTVIFPPTAGGRAASLVDLKVSWPAPVAPSSTTSFVETLVAMDMN